MKASLIESEDVRRVGFLCQSYKRGVREVHGEVAILFEKLTGSSKRASRLWYQHGTSPEEEIQHGLRTSAKIRQQCHAFGENGFRRQKVTLESFEEYNAAGVMDVAPVKQRDERSGIEDALTGGHGAPSREARDW